MSSILNKIRGLFQLLEKQQLRKNVFEKYGADLSIDHMRVYNNIEEVILNERQDKESELAEYHEGNRSIEDIIEDMLLTDVNLFMVGDKLIYCEVWECYD